MKVYLVDRTFDKDEPQDCSWHCALKATFTAIFQGTEKSNPPPLQHSAYDDTMAVIFAHSNGYEPDWRTKADSKMCQIVLVRNDGRQGAEHNQKGSLHGCYWSPEEWKSKSTREVSRFIAQVMSGVVASQVDWGLLEAPRSEELQAFRLLCEAKRACGDSATKSLYGINVCAPSSLKDWLAPFGKADASEISKVAMLIGTGEIKTSAEAVLNAANGSGNLDQTISEFLRLSAAQKSLD